MKKWVVFLSIFVFLAGVALLQAEEGMQKEAKEAIKAVKDEVVEKAKDLAPEAAEVKEEAKAAKSVDLSTIEIPVEKVYGVKMGKVTFPHAKHILDLQNSCSECHHAKKVEKDGEMVPVPFTVAKIEAMKAEGKNPFQCRTCHGNLSAKAFKKLFHSNCFRCHKMAKAAGKKAPTKCKECHAKPKKKAVEGC